MTGKNEHQFRIDFYKAKRMRYSKRYPGRLPSRSTFRRWTRECNNALAARQVPAEGAAPQPGGDPQS